MSRKKTRKPDPSGVHTLASDSFFSKLFKKIQTEIIILDAETHTIVYANPLAEKILGFTRDQLMGRCFSEFI